MSSLSSGTTSSTGLVHTSDTSGDLLIKTGSSATTAMTISGSTQAVTLAGSLVLGSSTLAAPSGSAPSYTCRAWVNFNGTGTVAIRASGNVSSITDNGTGDYTVNFTTAMPDANFCCVGMSGATGAFGSVMADQMTGSGRTSSYIRIGTASNVGSSLVDDAFNNVAIFR